MTNNFSPFTIKLYIRPANIAIRLEKQCLVLTNTILFYWKVCAKSSNNIGSGLNNNKGFLASTALAATKNNKFNFLGRLILGSIICKLHHEQARIFTCLIRNNSRKQNALTYFRYWHGNQRLLKLKSCCLPWSEPWWRNHVRPWSWAWGRPWSSRWRWCPTNGRPSGRRCCPEEWPKTNQNSFRWWKMADNLISLTQVVFKINITLPLPRFELIALYCCQTPRH